MIGVVKLKMNFYLILIIFGEYVNAIFECNQRLYEAKGNSSIGSNGFSLQIHSYSSIQKKKNEKLSLADEPTAIGYVPGKLYQITLQGWRTQFFVQTFRGFGITAVFENNVNKTAGKFEIKKVIYLNFKLLIFLIYKFRINEKETLKHV